MFDSRLSDIPGLLRASEVMKKLDWGKLGGNFSLTTGQIELLIKRPNENNLVDVYRLSDTVSALIDEMVN